MAQRFIIINGMHTKPIPNWLENALICGEDYTMEYKLARNRLKDTGLGHLLLYKLDEFSIIMLKKEDNKYNAIVDDEKSKLRTCFEYVAPWHREYGIRDTKRYDLIGVSLHFWCDEDIKMISTP